MAVTLTGNKYTGTITTVNNLTITDSGASFSSADFTVSLPRMAWLFRGGEPIALSRINSQTSSTVIQLDQPFFDIDGEEVVQQVGDTYYISLLFSEVITTGLAVSGGVVTCTDRLDFGVSGDKTSVFIHSENEFINTNQTGNNNNAPFQFFGGCSTFGNPLDLKNRVTASSSTVYSSTTSSGHGMCVKSIDATQMHFGTTFIFENGNTGRMPGGAGSGGFTPAFWQVFVNCNMNGNFVTPSGGALWSSRPSFQRLINTNSAGTGTNLINSRWADGFFEGGSFQNSRNGLAPFGSDTAGTFEVAATAGNRITVFDCAQNAIWRSNGSPVQTINFTNVLVRDAFKNSIGDNKTFNFIFREIYTGLLEGTKLYIEDTNGTLVDSQTLGSSGITDPVNITYQTRQTTPLSDQFFNPWVIRFYKYGSQIISAQIDAGTNTVAGQTVVDISFGGPLVQSSDTLITETVKATVDSYTETETAVKIYDGLASYLIDNSTNQSDLYVTRSGNIIDAGSYDVEFDGTGTGLPTVSGNKITVNLNSIAYTDGIETTGTVTAANGADISLASISSSAGVNTKITISDLSSSNVFIRDDSDLQYDYQTGITGQYQITTPVGASGIWKVVIDRAGYASQVFTFTAGAGDVSYSGALGQLFQPSGSAMYTGSSNPLLSVVPETDASRLNIRIGDGTVTAQEIFDESEDALSTATGMHYLANGGQRVEIALLPTGTFLFMRDNVRLIRDTTGDANATVEAFVTSTQGTILDNTNGGVQFVTVTRAQQLIEYGGHIYVDVDAGVDSSVYPFGTQASPVSSWDNAKVLCEFYGLRDVKFTGTMMHTSDAVGYAIEGSDAGAILVLQGYDISKSKFSNIIATGDAGNPAQGVQFRGCYVEGVTNFNGVMDEVIFTGSVTVTGERNYFTRCSSAVVDDDVVVLSINNAGQCTTSVRDFYGRMTLGGVSNALNTVSIDSESGDIELLASNTAGTITIRGEVTTFVDNSTGATVTTAFLATQADIDNLKNFDPATDQVIVATNNDKTDYTLTDVDKDDIVDKMCDEPLTGATHNVPTSLGRRIRQLGTTLAAEGEIIGTPTTIAVQTDLVEINSSFYSDQTFRITSGVLAGQARVITSYDGVTKTCNFDEPWTVAPSATDTFEISSDHVHPVTEIALGVDTALTSTHGSGTWTTGSGGDDAATIWAFATRGLTEDVTTDTASRNASKADVSLIGTKANQQVLLDGIKDASLIIPFDETLPDS